MSFLFFLDVDLNNNLSLTMSPLENYGFILNYFEFLQEGCYFQVIIKIMLAMVEEICFLIMDAERNLYQIY